jgi:hypothetical protein
MLTHDIDGDLSERLISAVSQALERVPTARGALSGRREPSSSSSRGRPDWTAKVTIGSQEWLVAVEAKRVGQPREVRNAVLQLKDYLQSCPETDTYGIVAAPFISTESAQICADAGVGFVDLAGNARLAFGPVYIETRSAENPFRERKEARSLFGPRACRVLRTLLQGPLRPWKVAVLAKDARVSLGWVSAVRQQLLAREWAVDDPSGLRISKPDAILDAWTSADRWKSRTTVRQYSLLLAEPNEIAIALRDFLGDVPHAFTQWFAGWTRHPYTIPPVVSAYVDDFPDEAVLRQRLHARRVDDGGRLWLVKPRDDGVLRPTQSVAGFTLVPDVQIYVDLHSAGQRGAEQAAELRRASDFAGGWNT